MAFLVFLGSCVPLEDGGPKGEVTFGVVGDAPYYWWEERRFDYLMRTLDRDSLDMLIHVGDVLWRPCSGELMRDRLSRLVAHSHPVIFTPGDNDWADCWGNAEGRYEPLDRLDTLRAIFYPEPGKTLGARAFEVEYQGSRPQWFEFVENTRWMRAGVVFATIHIVGSWNARAAFDGRTGEDDAASDRRTAAAAAWVDETFAVATASGAGGVVLFTHAFPDAAAYSPEHRAAFDPYLKSLEEQVAAFDGQVLLVHGDNHEYTVDQPLADRRTGSLLDNFTRLQVMGSPDVGWVRVVMGFDGNGIPTFDFTPRTVSGWRIW